MAAASRKRDVFALGRKIVSLIGLFVLAACATETAPVASMQAPTAVRANILAVRAVPATASLGGTARLLGSTASTQQALSEFIVRTEDGRTLSVVQPAEADLTVGSQAVFVSGSRPRLTHQL